MKDKMLDFLENNWWTNGSDNELIKDFIIAFFEHEKPKEIFSEFGSAVGIRFNTSDGELHIKAGESIILKESDLNGS